MITYHDIKAIIEKITYKPGWAIAATLEESRYGGPTRPYIQISMKDGVCARTGEPAPWKSGKRYLSFHMCRQEIVGAVFGLIKDAEEHETREWFRYRGAAIFNPHLDPDVLADVARKRASFVFRENAMSMEEGQ